ncbi:hypothetical protein ABZ569_26190 [Streptomyces albus]
MAVAVRDEDGTRQVFVGLARADVLEHPLRRAVGVLGIGIK